MKRLLPLISFIFFLSQTSFANHITGGQMYYTYLGQSCGNYQYAVTLLLYRDSLSIGAQLDATAAIAVFDKSTNAMMWSGNVPLAFIEVQHLQSPGACITNPPTVIYQVGHYTVTISVPASPSGYIVAYQRCCRIAGINNILGSSTVGATYTADIPGNSVLSNAPVNNSARFIGVDTVAICSNYPFRYSFAASDPDGDSLSYYFCDGYVGGSAANAAPNPPAPPIYPSVPYSGIYGPTDPLGPGISIDSKTGLISGIAPPSGIYEVTVCVTEFRNDFPIATQRKDLQIKVADCSIAVATLQPQYISCDGFTMSFSNLTGSPLISSYYWDFGVVSQTNDTSNIATPTFTYSDTGVYVLKLVTNRNRDCSDSTTALVKVFPGFFPGFTSNGICINKPTQFTDTTKTAYGVVNSWSWNFGDNTSVADTSHMQNPAWTYSTLGAQNIQFIAGNSKGCVDTVFQTVNIIDKPPIALAFRDTLICIPDAVQLNASGSGVFNWTPSTNIINANTGTPTVNPNATAWYVVHLDDNGCLNQDSVRVRVISFVSVTARNDTTICSGDPVMLGANTDGLSFLWTPSASINNPTLLNAIASPATTTTYQLQSSVGSCNATDNVTIFVVPYPGSNAGPDVTICYNTSTQLNGSIVGSSFNWSPASSLSNSTILNPLAYPVNTTAYILSVYDTIGCPKPGLDTVFVTVLPRLQAYAGHDTSVVIGQPLQFNATGGVNYLWDPPTGLNNINISDPVGIYSAEVNNIRYKVLVNNQAGCFDSAFVNVKVYKTNPYIFVPSAFTPNGDGLNDIIRPIAVGIKQIEYFSIYNRWGQMVFTTTVNGQGWDGKFAGQPQNSGTYVWMVKAIDYKNIPVFLKGTVTLIR
ncbi:MAG TPA: T9SS type B sorting domain-containing protein [Chitinophagaceae bacterium]|nr:T9SS type B sorting domain-containing protein [Chitinophagaceae bacterium]